MKNRLMKIFGAISCIVGAFLLIIQPFTPITGAVIDVSSTISKINLMIGLLLIIFGIILLSAATIEERTPLDIVWSKRFRKDIKRLDRRVLAKAISKIGTGLADEKHLHDYAGGGYQIRVDKGGRIHYRIGHDGRIILTDYQPSSEHS